MALYSIILAAGEGKRMKSKYPKPLHSTGDKALINHVLSNIQKMNCDRDIVVTGYMEDKIKEHLGNDIEYAYQPEQKGVLDAIIKGVKALKVTDGTAVVVCADMPLITSSSLIEAYKMHLNEKNSITFLSTDNNIEFSGAMMLDIKTFVSAIPTLCELDSLANFTDINSIGVYNVDAEEIFDVNDRNDLAVADKIINKRNTERMMLAGVTVFNPESVRIGCDVTIGRDTVIYPGTILEGSTSIGSECVIGPNTRLTNCIVGDSTEIQASVAVDSEIGTNTNVGPFAYIRPNSKIGNNIKVGDFVEVKNANIGDGTKIAHLTYVGDADVGERVNFGCGTVVVNYDGVHKNRTVIEDDCFIGCNTNLVSPVVVRKGGYTAAGSTITDEVPENSLAIARARQVNKTSWQRPKK